MKKKLLTILIGILLISATSVFGYATIKFVVDKIVDQNVTIGDTVKYTDGLFIELDTYDNATLTFFDIDETDTQKHYLTYTYNYTILVDGLDIEVSSLSDDIVVNEFTTTESTISITFSLNQEKEYNDGDTINVQFYFEGVEAGVPEPISGTNPLNINFATDEQLAEIGLSETQIAIYHEKINFGYFADYNEWSVRMGIAGFYQDYEQQYLDGWFTFEH